MTTLTPTLVRKYLEWLDTIEAGGDIERVSRVQDKFGITEARAKFVVNRWREQKS